MNQQPESEANLLSDAAISALEWEVRKEFFGFGKEDEKILSELQLVARTYADEVIEDLYRWFFQFDDVKAYFPDENTVLRVKKLQKQYFLSLTRGDYGIDFLNQRLQVGRVHRRIGLPPHLYMGAYSFYMQSMLPRVLAGFEYDRAKRAQATTALVKLIALDQAVVLGAYFEDQDTSISTFSA